jgi:hypothetical protein
MFGTKPLIEQEGVEERSSLGLHLSRTIAIVAISPQTVEIGVISTPYGLGTFVPQRRRIFIHWCLLLACHRLPLSVTSSSCGNDKIIGCQIRTRL